MKILKKKPNNFVIKIYVYICDNIIFKLSLINVIQMAESNQLNQGLTHIFQNLWGGKYRNKAVESQCDKPHLFPAIKPAYGGQKSSKSTTWMLQQALLTLTTTERWGFVQINLIKSIQPNKKQHILAHYSALQCEW